jgi:hypothetical protein
MEENSSSSSSSLDSSSSSTSSSSSFGYSYSTSSSSSSNSSSSSIDSSSSSSSSYLDYNEDRLLPFYYEVEYNNSINCISFDKIYAYAGTSTNGAIIRSRDRYFWEKFAIVNDEKVTSMISVNNYLFVGTAPNGRLFRVSLSGEEIIKDAEFGGMINGLCTLNNDLYCSLESPPKIYKFNFLNESWEIFYEPYGSKINQFSSIDNRLLLALDSQNILSYENGSWEIKISMPDNISTARRVSKNVFSHQSYNFIDTKSIKSTENLHPEDILDVFPLNRLIGIGSFALDGSTFAIGGSNYGRVLNYNNGDLNTIYETDSDGVDHIVNLSLGANLVSMKSRLYLTYCGKLDQGQPVVEEEEDQNAGKSVYIISPNGSETLVIGSTVEILWGSTRSINDSVKLSLYRDEQEVLVIVDDTLNNGSYLWEIPITLENANNYKIYIEWLSASSEVLDADKDFSDAFFSLSFFEEDDEQDSTQQTSSEGVPDLSECRGIPLLALNNGEEITFMTKDVLNDGILISTSFGRIIYTDGSSFNSYLSGERLIYGNARNGYGINSETASKSFLYALSKKILEINSNKEIEKKSCYTKSIASPIEEVSAVFVSPILNAEEDFGFWKNIIWSEQKFEETEITICLRSSDEISKLRSTDWAVCFNSYENESSPIERELNNENLRGRFAQIQVIMKTKSSINIPLFSDVLLSYASKRSQYFFTVKFSLESIENINKGMLTGTIAQPKNTEVIFGYSDKNSANWEDYHIINPNSFFDINDIKNLKVGIKMVSYDGSLPSVEEFSLLYNSENIL